MVGRDKYHHGDLKNALLLATIELVRERGTRGFSVAEAARQAGVSISAPYRHFADRDALLAAVAQQAFVELEETFAELILERPLSALAMQIAGAYVEFAREDPARFEVMFASGIDKALHPELLEQTQHVQSRFEAALAPYISDELIAMRAAELWSIAHGVAALTVGGNLHHVIDGEADLVAASAANAWVAGIEGADR